MVHTVTGAPSTGHVSEEQVELLVTLSGSKREPRTSGVSRICELVDNKDRIR